jgi:hypothetical protein
MVRWLGLLLALLGPGLADPALAGVQVQVDAGRISAVFEDAPVPDALAAIRRAGGPEIVLPADSLSKTLTLAVERAPLEEFMRRLLRALDLGGFALVYESDGAAGRVVLVDRSRGLPPPEPPADPAASAEPPPAASAGPVYIPPREPPVYIPPREPPVYVPPASPPVYIPPASPPVYVPPASEPQPAPPAQ